VKYTLDANSTSVCNGKDGTTGFTATLPSEKTETGSFAQVVEGEVAAPISFAIPLAEPLPAGQVHKTGDTGFAGNCPGSPAEPEAEPGNLCVYVATNEFGPATVLGPYSPTGTYLDLASDVRGAATAGAFLYLTAPGALVWGTWAVTAE
jgi:hypothetical protein